MGRYIIRRSLQAIPLLLLLSIFMFLLIHALPGGPDQVIFNPHLDAAGRAALRARFGLDQPLPVQYLVWLRNCLVGDFGYSFATNQDARLSARFVSPGYFCGAVALASRLGHYYPWHDL